MSDFLEQVIAERRQDVAAARRVVPDASIAARAQVAGRPPRLFWRSLLADRAHLAVIAEVKRVSPALGALSTLEFDPATQAMTYAAAGARAISVLTEPRHWRGSLDDLRSVRKAVDVPILAKDIVVDPYQIYEAREAGADAVLLIAEAFDEKELAALVACAERLGMAAVVEAHDATAFGRAVHSGTWIVGVNARDLRKPTELDIGRVRQLHTFVKAHQFLVAESGIGSVDDARMLPARVDAVLVGTALMRAEDPAPLIREIASIRRAVPV
jgi:indole-3-glycerol phosphate synthase